MKQRLTASERLYRREAANYGRQAISAIHRTIEHQQEYRRWVELAERAKLNPDKTNAPIWRVKADKSQAVAVRCAIWAAREAHKAEQIAETAQTGSAA